MSNWIYEFENQVHHRGPEVAVIHGGREKTFDELNRNAASVAHFLTERGASRVATYVTNCYEFYPVEFGVLKAGAVGVAANYMFGEDTLRYVLKDSEAQILAVAGRDLDKARAAAAGTSVREIVIVDGAAGTGENVTLADILRDYPDVYDSVPKSDDDLFNVTYTSGTTGTPKGVMKSHRNISVHTSNMVHVWKLGPASRWLCAGPVYHTSGLESSSLPVLVAGGTVVSLRWQVDDFFRHVDRYRPDAAYIAGSMLVDIADYPDPERWDLSSLQFVVAGGAPLAKRAYDRVRERYSFVLTERLGMTEAGIIFAYPVGTPGTYSPELERPYHRPGSCGRPLYNQTEFRLVDPVTREIRQAGEGELQVRGDSVFRGYLNMPERTAQSFTEDGWFITGDIVRIEDDHVWHLRRRDEMIISGGENVSPRTVENAVCTHPEVAEAAAFPLPHDRWGQEVCVAVVPRAGSQLTEEGLLDYLRASELLAKYEIPKRVFFRDSLPKTPTQSVPRSRLTQEYDQPQQVGA